MPISAVIVLIASIGALPEGVAAHAQLDPPLIPFHQPAAYTIVLEVPAGTTFQMPSMLGRFDGLDVAGAVEEREDVLDDGRVRVTETYRVEAIFPGHYAIEPAVVTVEGIEYALPSPVLRVRELTPEEAAIAEEFDAALPKLDAAIAAPFYRRWWFWACMAAAAIIGALAAIALRRRSNAPESAPKTPWEIALARLEALKGRELPAKRDFDRFYVDLSAILRYYIEGRFALHAPERTTQEFLTEMTGTTVFDARQEAFLASFLKHCDYVKFARFEPGTTEMADRFEQVVRFVQETVPAESAGADAEAA